MTFICSCHALVMESAPDIWLLHLTCPPPSARAAAAFVLGCVHDDQTAHVAQLGGWQIDTTEHEGKLMQANVISAGPEHLAWLRSAQRITYARGHYYQPTGLVRQVDLALDEVLHEHAVLISITADPSLQQLTSLWQQIASFALASSSGRVQWGGQTLSPVSVSLQVRRLPHL